MKTISFDYHHTAETIGWVIWTLAVPQPMCTDSLYFADEHQKKRGCVDGENNRKISNDKIESQGSSHLGYWIRPAFFAQGKVNWYAECITDNGTPQATKYALLHRRVHLIPSSQYLHRHRDIPIVWIVAASNQPRIQWPGQRQFNDLTLHDREGFLEIFGVEGDLHRITLLLHG